LSGSQSPPPAIQKSNTPSIVAGIVLIAVVVTIALVYVETRPATPAPSGPPGTLTVCGSVSSGSGFYSGDVYRLDFKTSSQLTSATVGSNTSSCVVSLISTGCNGCYSVDLTNNWQFSINLIGSGNVMVNQTCGGLFLNQPSSPYRFDVSC